VRPRPRVVLALLLALGVTGCAHRAPKRPAAPPQIPLADTSGFLDDYSLLAPGGPDQPTWVYRDPAAPWRAYTRVVFEPVTIWRSGQTSLQEIPQSDLERLSFELHRSVRLALARHFDVVEDGEPGPGTVRVRLGLTQARQADALLDIFTWAVPPPGDLPATEKLSRATRDFAMQAAIEGEISDATSGRLLAAGVDHRRGAELRTWGDVRAAADRWAAWLSDRIERARATAPPE
jgi:hypothetical protein